MIFVIEDNELMAECIGRAVRCAQKEAAIFQNAIEAMNALDDELPEIIFLDVLLDGPDGFTFLNEIASYRDTANIPIVIVSSLNLKLKDLRSYGVVRVLDKSTMMPADIVECVKEYGK